MSALLARITEAAQIGTPATRLDSARLRIPASRFRPGNGFGVDLNLHSG
jgi:hypothetical protein